MDNKKRIVMGFGYNEALKEDVLRSFRQNFQRYIKPDIINNTLFKIEFVPIKKSIAPFNFI